MAASKTPEWASHSDHIIAVSGDPEYQNFTLICPDGGEHCERWVECYQPHPCPDPECDGDCDDDEWLYVDGMSHGVAHENINGMACVLQDGCWMQLRDLEFNDPGPFPDGRYTFTYHADDDDWDSNLFIYELIPEVDHA